jgi:hypothetical protein
VTTTAALFYKFHYYISIVPTLYNSIIGPPSAPDYHLLLALVLFVRLLLLHLSYFLFFVPAVVEQQKHAANDREAATPAALVAMGQLHRRRPAAAPR